VLFGERYAVSGGWTNPIGLAYKCNGKLASDHAMQFIRPYINLPLTNRKQDGLTSFLILIVFVACKVWPTGEKKVVIYSTLFFIQILLSP
jgi:hypothetical protein